MPVSRRRTRSRSYPPVLRDHSGSPALLNASSYGARCSVRRRHDGSDLFGTQGNLRPRPRRQAMHDRQAIRHRSPQEQRRTALLNESRSPDGAQAQSRAKPHCAEPVIGRAFARPVGLVRATALSGLQSLVLPGGQMTPECAPLPSLSCAAAKKLHTWLGRAATGASHVPPICAFRRRLSSQPSRGGPGAGSGRAAAR